ncbi:MULTISPECIES: LuxR C-terminal-related transcriptional regulator [unclassified Streptomyces]|uniref:LuxR C-terminal-related transcriptional regulator n=1 Tax=unclassified Streptomyces TaxID=2593676 RepID=UPI003D8A6ED9
MPVLDGVAAAAALREKVPGSAVLVLTTYMDDNSVFPALRADARCYLIKDADDEEVETAIRRVHGGRTWLDPVVQARLVATRRTGLPAAGADALPGGLTPREAEVLTLIAQDLSNAQICAGLVVSQATVKTHINRIFAKVGATDCAQAVGYAYRNNLADGG